MLKVSAIQGGPGSAQEKAALLAEVYNGMIAPLMFEQQEQTWTHEGELQLYQAQLSTFNFRNGRADLIRQKLDAVTREYGDQYKHFGQKHLEIRDAEVSKREQISANFETHLVQITQQIADEKIQMQVPNDDPREGEPRFWANEVVKENNTLERKYQELLKEIEDKSGLMARQLAQKGESTEDMEAQIQGDLGKQEANVAEQTQLYKAQTAQKTQEHAELAKILKEYRAKFAEFEKATKKTKDYYKNFEREIRTLDQRKKDLTAQKKALQGHKASGKHAERKETWEAQKATLLQHVDALKAQCATLVETIKVKKQH